MTYGLLWAIWIVLFFGSFLAIEIPAYRTHRNATLSDMVWRTLGIHEQLTWRYRFFRLALVFSLVWLFGHFISGGWY